MIFPCAGNPPPLTVVMAFTPSPLYGNDILIAVFAAYAAFLP